MNTANIVVGLDIRTTKIAAIVGRRSEYGKIEILGYGRTESIGVKRGIVSNIELTVDSIKRAIQEAEAKLVMILGLEAIAFCLLMAHGLISLMVFLFLLLQLLLVKKSGCLGGCLLCLASALGIM
jgi:hypothetical protein